MRWQLCELSKLPDATRHALEKAILQDRLRFHREGVRYKPPGKDEMTIPDFQANLLPVVALWLQVPRDFSGTPFDGEIEVLLDRAHISGRNRAFHYDAFRVLRAEELRYSRQRKKERDKTKGR